MLPLLSGAHGGCDSLGFDCTVGGADADAPLVMFEHVLAPLTVRNVSSTPVAWLQVWAEGKLPNGKSAGAVCVLHLECPSMAPTALGVSGAGSPGTFQLEGEQSADGLPAPPPPQTAVERGLACLAFLASFKAAGCATRSALNASLPIAPGGALTLPLAFVAVPGLHSLTFAVAYAPLPSCPSAPASTSQIGHSKSEDLLMRRVCASRPLVLASAIRVLSFEVGLAFLEETFSYEVNQMCGEN